MQIQIYTCRKGHESSVSSGGLCWCGAVQGDDAWREADPGERASALAESFHMLRGADHDGPAPGVRPWDPLELASWAAEPERSAGQAHAARFVLEVWDAGHAWSCGPFRLGAAIRSWDERHRDAFRHWAREPFTLDAARSVARGTRAEESRPAPPIKEDQ